MCLCTVPPPFLRHLLVMRPLTVPLPDERNRPQTAPPSRRRMSSLSRRRRRRATTSRRRRRRSLSTCSKSRTSRRSPATCGKSRRQAGCTPPPYAGRAGGPCPCAGGARGYLPCDVQEVLIISKYSPTLLFYANAMNQEGGRSMILHLLRQGHIISPARITIRRVRVRQDAKESKMTHQTS